MPDFDVHESSGFRRLLLSLGALLLFGLLIAVGLSASGTADIFPMHAKASAWPPGTWDFAEPAIDQMNASAIQICGAETAARAAVGTPNQDIRQAQVAVLTGEYQEAEQSYNARVRTILAAGGQRPWDIPSKALPVDLAKSRNCIKVQAAPPRQSKPLTALSLTLSPGDDSGPVWLPDPDRRFLTLEQLDAAAAAAGWPNEPGWWPDMRKIILCETRSLDTMAHNTSDPNGGSYGLAQLNGSYHFANAGEDFARRYDPVVNLRVALWLRTARGHFGGSGGWYNCAKLWGID
ncbi:MAG: hypothetical protein AB7J35_02205 [Dehalococcoidia bacterium]